MQRSPAVDAATGDGPTHFGVEAKLGEQVPQPRVGQQSDMIVTVPNDVPEVPRTREPAEPEEQTRRR